MPTAFSFTTPGKVKKPRASFTITIDNQEREAVAIGEFDLDASIDLDNYLNIKRAMEQALYAVFFQPTPASRPSSDGTGDASSTTVESVSNPGS